MSKDPAFKFLVGFIAGLCAAVFPRLVAALADVGSSSEVALFGASYIIASLVFAVLIGAVMMIIEWKVPRRPRDTFMAALGVPALLSGALNMTDGVHALKNAEKVSRDVTTELQRQVDIPTLPPTSVTPVEKGISTRETSNLDLLIIRSAHAGGDYSGKGSGLDLGIQVVQPFYVIVLEQAQTEDQVREKANRLRKLVPKVEIVRTADGKFMVVEGGGPRIRSEALLEAIRLKKATGLSPSLLEVK